MSNDVAVEGFIFHYFLWKEKQALDLESSVQRHLEPVLLPPQEPPPYNGAATSCTFTDPVVLGGNNNNNNNNNNVVSTATSSNKTTNTSTGVSSTTTTDTISRKTAVDTNPKSSTSVHDDQVECCHQPLNPFLFSVKYRKVIQILSQEFPHLPCMYPPSMASRVPDFYAKILLSQTNHLPGILNSDVKNDGDYNETTTTTNQSRQLEPLTSKQNNDNTNRNHRKRDHEELSDYEEEDSDEEVDEGNDHDRDNTTGNSISNSNNMVKYKSFAYYYRRLLTFHKKHGHCQLPKPRGFSLYNWLGQVQLEYERLQKNSSYLVHQQTADQINPISQSLSPRKLTPDRIELLNQLHSGWWKRRYQTNYDDIDVETTTMDTTGQKVMNKSTNGRSTTMNNNRPARIMKWSEQYEQLAQFYIRFGHTKVPRQDPNYRALAEWANTQRTTFRQKLLPSHRVKLLNKIHFIWDYKQHLMTGISTEIKPPLADAILRVPFQERYQQCQEFRNEFGDLNIPLLFEKNMDGSNPTEEQQNFRFWAQCVRYEYEQFNIRLKNEQSKMSTTKDDRKRTKRYKTNPNSLTQDRIDKLTELGFVWVKDSTTDLPTTTTTDKEGCSNINNKVMLEERFDQRVEQVRIILEYFGHCSYSHICQVFPIEHYTIFRWIINQRYMYRQRYVLNLSSCLTEERLQKLENIHFVFDPSLKSTKNHPKNHEQHNVDVVDLDKMEEEEEEEMEGYC